MHFKLDWMLSPQGLKRVVEESEIPKERRFSNNSGFFVEESDGNQAWVYSYVQIAPNVVIAIHDRRLLVIPGQKGDQLYDQKEYVVEDDFYLIQLNFNGHIQMGVAGQELFSPPSALTISTIPAGTQLRWRTFLSSSWRSVAVIFRREGLAAMFPQSSKERPDIVDVLLSPLNGVGFYSVPATFELVSCVREILMEGMGDYFKEQFLKAKGLEFLCLALNQDGWLKAREGVAGEGVTLLLDQAVKLIRSNLAAPLSVNFIAREIGTNRTTLNQLFKNHMQATVFEFIRVERLSAAWELLQRGYSVSDAANRVGYQEHSSFSRAFKNHFGISPKILLRQ